MPELENKSTPFDGYVPFLMGQFAIDISTKVISNLIHSRTGAIHNSNIKNHYSELTLVRSPKLLGMYLDNTFHLTHTEYKWPIESAKETAS